MSQVINFVLLREGRSDDALEVVLRNLLSRVTSSPVVGSTRDYGGTVESKLRQLQSESGQVDLVFVHRDADGPQADQRLAEIRQAANAGGLPCPVLPLVPIQETEAWLLLDEQEIRRVVGNPTGKASLNIPRRAVIESTPNPKELLHNALLAASETSGRRRQKVLRRIPAHCRQLMEGLDINGPVTALTAWQRLQTDISATYSN